MRLFYMTDYLISADACRYFTDASSLSSFLTVYADYFA